MITNFKIFENTDKETTFILNDLIDYYSNDIYVDTDSLQDFMNIFLWRTIKFHCDRCTEDIDGVTHYINFNKIHKGEVSSRGYGFNAYDKGLYLSFTLKRIKYRHEVDTSKPITIYGDIDLKYLNIINDINTKKDANKYNL